MPTFISEFCSQLCHTSALLIFFFILVLKGVLRNKALSLNQRQVIQNPPYHICSGSLAPYKEKYWR